PAPPAEAPPPAPEAPVPAPAAEAPPAKPSIRQRIADIIDPGRQAELQKAFEDPMTGLANQTAFERARPNLDADPEIEIVALDVQNLKGLNDIEGRESADAFLSEVGRVAREVAEEHGIPVRDVFRAGGDEFAIAAPKGEAEVIAREVVDRIGERGIGDTELQTGLRMGVGETWHAADAAAQAAKKATGAAAYRPSPAEQPQPTPGELAVTPAAEPDVSRETLAPPEEAPPVEVGEIGDTEQRARETTIEEIDRRRAAEQPVRETARQALDGRSKKEALERLQRLEDEAKQDGLDEEAELIAAAYEMVLDSPETAKVPVDVTTAEQNRALMEKEIADAQAAAAEPAEPPAQLPPG
ncbi:hypothetical protein LCGC14_3052930, partial [marine sediment metagenome]